MKKEKVVFVISIITILISSIISVYAANYIYNSNEVEYDNTGKNITSTNVQGAIDELYTDANNYSSINTRVTNLETTISGKQNTITGGASTITSSNLTANRALVSNASGKVAASSITSTQLGYLSGVTSNIQTQLNNLNKQSIAVTARSGTLVTNGSFKINDAYFLNFKISSPNIQTGTAQVVAYTPYHPSEEVSAMVQTNWNLVMVSWIRTSGEIVVASPYGACTSCEIRIICVY